MFTVLHTKKAIENTAKRAALEASPHKDLIDKRMKIANKQVEEGDPCPVCQKNARAGVVKEGLTPQGKLYLSCSTFEPNGVPQYSMLHT